MSKKLQIGLVEFTGVKGGDTTVYKGTWKVRILEEFSNGKVLVKPMEHVSGRFIRLGDNDQQLVKKEEIEGVVEREVSNWDYFWGSFLGTY